PSTFAAVREFCLSNQVTTFILMVAAFKVFLLEASGQQDLTVGIPDPGRNRQETEQLIGSFANTLVLRTQISGGLTFREVLLKVRKVVLDAYAHRDMRYAKLISLLRPGAMLQEKPLFRVMMDFRTEGEDSDAAQLPGLTVAPMAPEDDSLFVGNDLTFVLQEHSGGLQATLRYKVALFDATTIRGMLARFKTVLERMLERPDYPLAEIWQQPQAMDKASVATAPENSASTF
ncbi:MAG: condensation domain-containing protein, partial [Candidatus Angelobacter sp.]